MFSENAFLILLSRFLTWFCELLVDVCWKSYFKCLWMACYVIPNYTIASRRPLELDPSHPSSEIKFGSLARRNSSPGKEIGWNTTQFTPTRSLHVILIYAPPQLPALPSHFKDYTVVYLASPRDCHPIGQSNLSLQYQFNIIAFLRWSCKGGLKKEPF